MTTNQIKFAELKEQQRHNLETEGQGRRKIQYDYEVGSRQAGASESHAAAAHRSADAALKNVDVNAINAATRQKELDFASEQYYGSGKNLQISQAAKNIAEADLTGSKQFAQDYQNSKTNAFGYWTIDAAGDMIGNMLGGGTIRIGDLK